MPLLLAASGFLEVRPGLIFWTLVTFFFAALVLRRVAWGPIVTRVEEREKSLQASLDAAKHERAEAEKLLEEQKAAIAQARREAAEMVRHNAEDVERLRADLLAKARAQAEELKSVAADLAVQIAEKLLGENLDADKQRRLAQQYVDALGGTAPKPPA
jgi:F-type H+-transporting ATPase subunit b